jgi:hypothetical protein
MSGITWSCGYLLEQINQAIFVIFMLKQVFCEEYSFATPWIYSEFALPSQNISPVNCSKKDGPRHSPK